MDATDVREPVPGAPPQKHRFGWVWAAIAALVVVGVLVLLVLSGGGGRVTLTYTGDEISLTAEGGATCLTRPILRR